MRDGALVVEPPAIDALLKALQARGWTPVGPTVRDGAIVYDRLESLADLPAGWTDEQEAGTYRLKRRADHALFGYVVGPHSWKKFLFPPREKLWSATRTKQGFSIDDAPEPAPRYAFIGVRGCELRAIAVQDRVFLGGPYADPRYRERREGAFIVAVHCAQSAPTCFCASMGTGPAAGPGWDLALTELVGPGRHELVVEAATERGRELLGAMSGRPAAKADVDAAREAPARAAAQQTRTMDAAGVKERLAKNLEHARWDDVAARCLTCANCTMVCPTCFCSSAEDVSDLTGDHAERWRSWDSCFTTPFAYLHGGSVRPTTRSKYRQWLTHKLSTWHDQFGSSGCVGCGRCITWCPVGIDLTVEAREIGKA